MSDFHLQPDHESTPHPPANDPFAPRPVSSYTASPYDRPSAYGAPTPPPAPPKQRKQPKTVSLSAAVIASVATSLLTCVLALVVMSYGLGVGDLLRGDSRLPAVSDTDAPKTTTNIVVDATAQTATEAVAEKVGPSVVGLVVTSSVNNYFFGASDSTSEGSGIVYSADGYIITNYHVVQSAVESTGAVSVYLPSDSTNALAAEVIGYDVSADLAVVKVQKTGLQPIETGDSDAIKVGQTAIAIGNPGGMDFMGSVSMGIISGLDRTLQLENSAAEIHLIQTDAAINPGNSGGALVNTQGQLIGINSAKMASENFEGMGFAIPVNDAVDIVDRIIRNVDTPQPYIGIEISTYYDASTLQMMGYPAGVVVSSVTEGSPADEAGLIRSDIITHLNGTAVTSYTAFNSEKAKYSPGDTVTLTVYRRGRTYDLSLTLGAANQ